MKRFKRLCALMLAVCCLAACACSKGGKETTEKTKREADEETTKSTVETDPTPTPSPSPSPTPTPSPTPVPPEFDESAARSYFGSITFEGVALVSKEHQTVYTHSQGYADREAKIPNDMDTVFEFGSVTKQFTAVAIMQLVEQGKISVDDTLDKYIPEYSHADQITIHQLLNMTSGVPDYLFSGALGFSWDDFLTIDFTNPGAFEDIVVKAVTTPITGEELVDKMSPLDLNFAPGTKFEYSNTNYYFLGMIIEQLSGMPYADYIRKNILEPLDLTGLYPDTAHLSSNGRTSLGFINFDFPHQDDSISYAVGVMTGTAEGLLEWEYAVMEGALLTKESWDQIFDGGQFGYGYGWYIQDGYVQHSGMTLGYNTSVILDIDNQQVIIVLSNIQLLVGSKSQPMSVDIGEYLRTL